MCKVKVSRVVRYSVKIQAGPYSWFPDRGTAAILPNPSLIIRSAKAADMIYISTKGLFEISQIKISLRSAQNLTTKRGTFKINFEEEGPKS